MKLSSRAFANPSFFRSPFSTIAWAARRSQLAATASASSMAASVGISASMPPETTFFQAALASALPVPSDLTDLILANSGARSAATPQAAEHKREQIAMFQEDFMKQLSRSFERRRRGGFYGEPCRVVGKMNRAAS